MNKLFFLLFLAACSYAPEAQLSPLPYPITDSAAVRPYAYTIIANRIMPDWYVTQEGVYIQTKNCYEEANNEKAVLVWQSYGYTNRVDFNSGAVCKVINLAYNPNQ